MSSTEDDSDIEIVATSKAASSFAGGLFDPDTPDSTPSPEPEKPSEGPTLLELLLSRTKEASRLNDAVLAAKKLPRRPAKKQAPKPRPKRPLNSSSEEEEEEVRKPLKKRQRKLSSCSSSDETDSPRQKPKPKKKPAPKKPKKKRIKSASKPLEGEIVLRMNRSIADSATGGVIRAVMEEVPVGEIVESSRELSPAVCRVKNSIAWWRVPRDMDEGGELVPVEDAAPAGVVAVVLSDVKLVGLMDDSGPGTPGRKLLQKAKEVRRAFADSYGTDFLLLWVVVGAVHPESTISKVPGTRVVPSDFIDTKLSCAMSGESLLTHVRDERETAFLVKNVTNVLGNRPYAKPMNVWSVQRGLPSMRQSGAGDPDGLLDTWINMLASLKGISQTKAVEIVGEFPSFQSLYAELEAGGDAGVLQTALGTKKTHGVLARRIVTMLKSTDATATI